MVELSELSFFCLDSEELWMERNFFFFLGKPREVILRYVGD